VIEDGVVHGTLGCDGFDRDGAEDGLKAIAEARSFDNRYRWEKDSFAIVSVKPYAPGDRVYVRRAEIPELLVVGTGPVARALVGIGEAMGFQVRVAAGPSSPGLDEFDRADEVILTPDARSVEALRPGPNTYVVICGHDEEFSQPVLRALMNSDSPYLGMMGSRRHTGHLYEELAERFSDEEIARVHSPVGLDLGAETPEEIALSAIAEIVAVQRGKPGRPRSRPVPVKRAGA
jgi:xanthine dehydrogenase accessory factor